ncbi:hypothetical protein JYT30_00760 [Desulfotalea psychrophila]|uniref:Uncharacterized protein n=1 Tax=Desulfotalea psychrophila TaxID=84980 RepID=A0ABS3AVY9_9BACT|nr:hypothetical protein [Desulfotalea psychrophila]MBN4071673.1 hypothetical protein [Desulfotalea psychrophila]
MRSYQLNSAIPYEADSVYYGYFTFKDLKEAMLAIGGGVTMANVNKTKFESLKV